MRKAISAAIHLLLFVLATHTGLADSTWEFSVQVSAKVQASPAQITLGWPQDTYMLPNSYTIYRKAPSASAWASLTTLPGSTTSFTDSNVSPGIGYEYQIIKKTSQYTGYGYVYAGMNLPLVDSRGRLLLVVDNTYTAQLANELARLEQDLIGDGWSVTRIEVGRNASVTSVKDQIRAQYTADSNVKAVFLFGHVPVPYSGDIVPDGHVPDHQGAWPCDAYYGDMDGVWTDSTVNDSSASEARNRNVPGDGKFDQSLLPAPVKLMVGRVDLANMPGRTSWGGPATFPSELELLRNYLNKDHKFRHKLLDVPRRAYISDFFGNRDGEAFVASGYRSFASMFGAENITTLPDKGAWVTSLSQNPVLTAYGCGAGTYTSVAGLGNTGIYQDAVTTEIVSNDCKTVFALIFGSWLGDWDSEDNFLRGILALPTYGLASAWSGRPHWFLHHMAMGETIGYSARLTQNNGQTALYQNQLNSCAGQIHIALMGDPTLRLHPVTPAANVVTIPGGSGTLVTWTPSADNVAGYHVYSAPSAAGSFTRLTPSPVTTTSFTDNTSASKVYMVRAIKLETSASGTYWNGSQGAFSATTTIVATTSPTNSIVPVTSSTSISISASQYRAANNTVAAPPPAPTGDSSNPTPTSLVNTTIWVDDAIPGGAVPGTEGGDFWSWINNDPSPISGNVSHQSSIGAGMHQHFFSGATSPLWVNTGDALSAYVYLDPANAPSEVMLQWYENSWDHRAYWGANLIASGNDGTSGRRYMGPLPAAGQWVQLKVPASQVDLEGKAVTGMAFSLYNGRVAWDAAGKTTDATDVSSAGNTNSVSSVTNVVLWMDDTLPGGASPGSDGGDTWNWVGSNPAPVSGSKALQSSIGYGQHQLFFSSAGRTLTIDTGDVLAASVYVDPANPPSEVMLQWNDGTWEHRAYWGANVIGYGLDGTPGRHYMGKLPAAGQWVQLTVPANLVGLEGSTLSGLALSLYNGRATWDAIGKIATQAGTSGGSIVTGSVNATNLVAWFDDDLPAGARPDADGGDSWNWVTASPSPISGTRAAQSINAGGSHQMFFNGATSTLPVALGESLIAYVYLDPATPPSEVMLQWNDGTWEHRAYWGANYLAFGTYGTPSRRYVGPLPTPGQWVRLEVPASQVGLEGSTLNGMGFSLYDGRATFDLAGKLTVANSGTVTNPPVVVSADPPQVITNSTPPVVTPPSTTLTNTPSDSSGQASIGGSNNIPGISLVDYVTLELPKPGDNTLHVLTPNLLELKLINTKQPDPAPVTDWDYVDSNGNFTPPAASALAVTADGSPVGITAIGFKRRPLYAPFETYDLRIENSLYLLLSSPISDNQLIEVKNPDGSVWAPTKTFAAKADPLRLSPAVHVNQEGYMPDYSKKAMIGYYAGSFGEISIPAASGFKLVDTHTGQTVYQGSLVQRPDSGYTYSPTPYQKVYEADFTAYKTPGEYRLVVPGMGGSLPFLIDNGIAMSFARAYALGLYHQRCGTNIAMPYARHNHDICHAAPATVPSVDSQYPFTWKTIADYARRVTADNPAQTAPTLVDTSSQLFPFVNQGPVDVSGGHHDAGDYSKYTCNSANLIHYLMFAVDSLPGVAALDNLGIPESGDGISDLLQEAKWEADFLAKMQDADGGFYFLVYPQNREYEAGVTPDKGDPQVVWPKTTSVTAASVAALAQCASSPAFKRAYPEVAAAYLQKAQLGWQFLQNAIAKYGKTGAYQKITHYGDTFTDQDELAWAACQMFLATGDQSIHSTLRSWFDPSDPSTWRWGWWHMSENYGHAIRSYTFAARNGLLPASAFDSDFLAKCQAEIIAAADSALKWSKMNAYGTSFPDATKRVQAAGWYFSTDQAFDLAVGYQIKMNKQYLDAIIANLNYEGGNNPVNVSFVTGLGWKRQRDIVSQWASTDREVLPPSGIPVGNITANFGWLSTYGGMLSALCFPSDNAVVAPYPFYDRWGDSWNVSAEFVVLNSARSLGCLAFVAAQTSLKDQAWKSVAGTISTPANIAPVGQPLTVALSAPGIDLTSARITWEARDQQPAFGSTYTFTPKNNGTQWIEAEAQLPDGRRVFASSSFNANAPDIVWCDDALPAGATTGADGGDSWNWIGSSPAPFSGAVAHTSASAPGSHQHFFINAAPLSLGTGDTLYAYVYLDPADPPSEVMLQWNDGSSWTHRAYWGTNALEYGVNGTTSRHYMGPLPVTGSWVQLAVAASLVGLEGKSVTGMAFSLYGGHATWDKAGRLSPMDQPSKSYASVNVAATTPAARVGRKCGLFTFTRSGNLDGQIALQYSLAGTALPDRDYEPPQPVVIAAGATSATLSIVPLPATDLVGPATVVLNLVTNTGYTLGASAAAELRIEGNTVPAGLSLAGTRPRMSWDSAPTHTYRIARKNKLADPQWSVIGQVTATSTATSWEDPQPNTDQSYYLVAQVD